MLLESAFHWLFCVKFSLKLVTFSKSYARKHKWLFFSEHSVVSVTDVCLDDVKLFKSLFLLQFLSNSYQSCHTFCVLMQKILEETCKILILKFLTNF